MSADLMRQEALRGMVLDLALVEARKVIESVRGTPLHFGASETTQHVAGVEWHLDVRYWKEEGDVVKITGHPHVEREPSAPEGLELPGGLGAFIFGPPRHEEPEGSFDFLVPVAWLPGMESSDG